MAAISYGPGRQVPPAVAQPHCLFVGIDGHLLDRSKSGIYAPETVDHLFQDFRTSGKHSLVIFIHGGLVPLDTGVQETASIVKGLAGTDSYVIGIVWRSDVGTVAKDLSSQNPLFKYPVTDGLGSTTLAPFIKSELDRNIPDTNLRGSLDGFINEHNLGIGGFISKGGRDQYQQWAQSVLIDSKPSSVDNPPTRDNPRMGTHRHLELQLGPITSAIWARMKTYIDRACRGDDPNSVIPQVLAKLRADPPADTILIGHSAGAIYADRVLEEAAREGNSPMFDLLFMAPALTYHEFGSSLDSISPHVRNFRMYALRDSVERRDTVINDWKDLSNFAWLYNLLAGTYPGSLLLFVSNALEGPADVPVLGLARFFDIQSKLEPVEQIDVDKVRSWTLFGNNSIGWSDGGDIVDPRPGFKTAAEDHGDFAWDPTTRDSIAETVTEWARP